MDKKVVYIYSQMSNKVFKKFHYFIRLSIVTKLFEIELTSFISTSNYIEFLSTFQFYFKF